VLLLALPIGAGASEFECLIEPSRVIELASPSAGVLDEVLVDRGDRVAAGQLVARLQSDVERATVEVAERRARLAAAIDAAIARIAFQKLELERRRELRKQDHVPERDLEEAETQTRIAELQLAELQENRELAILDLERTRAVLEMKGIRSRDAAFVVERYKNPGEYVEEEPVVRLAVVSPLHVETVLPVEMFGRVAEGSTATVLPEKPVGGEYVGKVTVVDDVLDAATSTFRVRLELPNTANELAAGLRCLVRFEPREGDGLAILPEGQEGEQPGASQGGG
jgi:RND family efflux transporter MFP subunit